MIKGILFLATGYALGYGHAMSQVPEVRDEVRDILAETKDVFNKARTGTGNYNTEGETPS